MIASDPFCDLFIFILEIFWHFFFHIVDSDDPVAETEVKKDVECSVASNDHPFRYFFICLFSSVSAIVCRCDNGYRTVAVCAFVVTVHAHNNIYRTCSDHYYNDRMAAICIFERLIISPLNVNHVEIYKLDVYSKLYVVNNIKNIISI